MTRSTIRLAEACAGSLAAGIAAAALAQATWAGLASTARLLTILGMSGTVVSLGWYGTKILLERREERLRAERRHRVPRPDRGTRRPPSAPGPRNSAAADADAPSGYVPAPEADAERNPEIQQAFDDFAQSIDPYLRPPTLRWMSESEAAQYKDLYARRLAGPS